MYDLVNDPDERDNRMEDPEQRRHIRELRGMLESWFAEQATAEHDGRNLPVAGGGQLRPVGVAWEAGSPAFVAH